MLWELDAKIGVITETWLSDGQGIEEDVSNFVLGTGIGMLYRNRARNNQGFSHGGVAIVFKSDSINKMEVKHQNPKDFEVMAGVGTLPGHSRRFVVIACYIPPGYTVGRGRSCLDYSTAGARYEGEVQGPVYGRDRQLQPVGYCRCP